MEALLPILLGGLIGVVGAIIGAATSYWFTRRLESDRRQFELAMKKEEREREQRKATEPSLSEVEKRVVHDYLRRGGQILERDVWSRVPPPVLACFPLDSVVRLADGHYQELGKIEAGAFVQTYNHRHREIDVEKVQAVRRETVTSMVCLNGVFRTTATQQLLADDQFREATHVSLGSSLHKLAQDPTPITSITLETGAVDVVSLELASGNAYFVRSAEGELEVIAREATSGKRLITNEGVAGV